MGLFGSKKEGGILDVIRCDEPDYLVWKWSPNGQPSKKESAIRYGSSLRVKDGEVAVFFYKQQNGTAQDFIEGPCDQIIKTANFPVLTSIVGAAFGGNTPFQAEIYFINIAGAEKIPFFIDNIALGDYRDEDINVPASIKGSVTFCISNYQNFIKKNQLKAIDPESLKQRMIDTIKASCQSIFGEASKKFNIPITRLTSKLSSINASLSTELNDELEVFGIHVKRIDVSEININKNSEEYQYLADTIINLKKAQITTDSEVMIKNKHDMQAIGAENMAETMRINREEAQRRQRLQSESSFITAHQMNLQADVAKTAATSLGQMGAGMDFGSGGGMNPAGMMAGMMMGGVVGSNMANMMGNAMQGMNQPQPPQPPIGAIAQYHVSLNGQQAGPYTLEQLKQLISAGNITLTTYLWKPGMPAWDTAGNIPEVASLFGCVPPPMPPMPQTPPTPPTL